MKDKRLTKRKENGAVEYDNGNGYYHTIYSGNDGNPVHAMAWKLAELEDKIEQGTLKEIPEGAVVLTREEHQKYLAFKIIEPQIIGCLDRERILERTVECLRANAKIKDEHLHVKLTEQVRKETVDKFAERLKKEAYGDDGVYYLTNTDIDEIAKEITEGE